MESSTPRTAPKEHHEECTFLDLVKGTVATQRMDIMMGTKPGRALKKGSYFMGESTRILWTLTLTKVQKHIGWRNGIHYGAQD